MNDTTPTYADALHADNLDAALHWIDDGHQVRVTLDYAQFAFAVLCPFEGADLAGKPWDELPVCRRVLDEDGQPQPHRSPNEQCYLDLLGREFTSDEFFDSGSDVPVFEVVSPFPVVYRFEGWDSEAVYVRPKPAISAAAARLAELEKRHDAIWDVVLELRQAAIARDLDPYKDPATQAISAILTGGGAWQITYGTLIEARDDLDAAKARAIGLWERTKFEAEEHATDWEQRGDGSLALVAWDEEQWFDCGPVIQRLAAEPQPEGQSVAALAGAEADR